MLVENKAGLNLRDKPTNVGSSLYAPALLHVINRKEFYKEKLEIAELLINAGADLSLKDHYGDNTINVINKIRNTDDRNRLLKAVESRLDKGDFQAAFESVNGTSLRDGKPAKTENIATTKPKPQKVTLMTP